MLVKELEELGATDIRLDDAGCVYATIPANCDVKAPVVGFIAHMDTTPDASGTNVTPRIIENYDGKDIVLNAEKDIVMRTEVFEHMLNYVGQDLIVTDGTTLLGADDKAGVAEIMNMVEYFATHPEVKHGTIKVGFTTDEEVGKGGKYYDIGYFNADFAYTFDGQTTGEINAETFNAADANVTIHGVQGHVAYPHLADNPVHRAAPFLNELVAIEWDQGNEFFPATSMQIANIQAGTGSNNVIPGELFVQFNFRFSTELTDEMIKAQVLALLEKHQLRYTVDWWLSGQPFLTARGKLVDAVVNAVEHYNEIKPQLLTTGGTSDGRFIARMGAQVVELGPVNATIHKINECVNAADLQLLARMYQRIMEQLVA